MLKSRHWEMRFPAFWPSNLVKSLVSIQQKQQIWKNSRSLGDSQPSSSSGSQLLMKLLLFTHIKTKYIYEKSELLNEYKGFTLNLIKGSVGNFSTVRISHFNTQPSAVVKSATMEVLAGNQIRDLANLVQCSAK